MVESWKLVLSISSVVFIGLTDLGVVDGPSYTLAAGTACGRADDRRTRDGTLNPGQGKPQRT